MKTPPPNSTHKRTPPYVARAMFVVLGLAAWFWTQSLIGHRAFPAGMIGDGVHSLTAPIHQYLIQNRSAANALLIVSSGFIDLFGIFLLARGIFGPSIRPFLALLMVFALRQMCQATCALPPPDEMIWRNPGFPSLLVTYGVANDLFFSGHTALAVLGAIELAQFRRRWLTWAGITIAIFEAFTVLVLRAHYTMDVFTGAVTAIVVSGAALRFAPAVDQALIRFFHRKQKQSDATTAQPQQSPTAL